MATDTETPAPLTLIELTEEEQAREEDRPREYKRIPGDTTLVAELMGVQLSTMPYNERDDDGNDTGVKAQRYEFEFKIVEEGEWKNYRVWGEVKPEFKRSSSCWLFLWVQELLGQEVPPNFTLDFDHLVGLRARIKVGYREWDKNGKKGSKNYVKWVSRLTGDEPAAAGTVAEFRSQNTGSFDDDLEPF